MAFVLAEHPIKHPSYPNGDHYAVLDTDNGQVGYFTLDEIKRDIEEEGTQFIGNHPLAIKDTKSYNYYGHFIERFNSDKRAILVYYMNSQKVIVEFRNTGNLTIVYYSDFKHGKMRDRLEDSRNVYLDIKDASLQYPNAYKLWKCRLYKRRNIVLGDFKTFSKFLSWYNSQLNLLVLDELGIKYDIDKDILCHKYGKESTYDSKYCLFIPSQLNRGIKYGCSKGIYPVGVYYCVDKGHPAIFWQLKCKLFSINKGSSFRFDAYKRRFKNEDTYKYYYQVAMKFKGINNIPEEQWAAVGYCFLEYKKHKEELIHRLAEYWYYYKHTDGQIYHCITKECYDALMNWEVDIND